MTEATSKQKWDKDRPCERCGQDYTPRSFVQKRCDPCREALKVEEAAERQARQARREALGLKPFGRHAPPKRHCPWYGDTGTLRAVQEGCQSRAAAKWGSFVVVQYQGKDPAPAVFHEPSSDCRVLLAARRMESGKWQIRPFGRAGWVQH